MPGLRKETYYIQKFGEILGKQKYSELLKNRESRQHRHITSSTVQCQLCKKKFKRITKTHLRYNCIENITTAEYLIRFPNASLISKELKKTYSNTKESIISKYGETRGLEKWISYQTTQAITNTFDYKSKKFGISKEDFNQYNKSRAATLNNFIIRYGEEEGINKWNDYCNRQRYTASLEYFIETYGIEQGTIKYENFVTKRLVSKKNQSKIELVVYEELKSYLQELELSVRLDNLYFGPYDFGNVEKKKLIEFYGTYWHADPRFFNEDDIIKQKKQTASSIRSRDQAKRTFAINRGFKIYIIWEHDWYKNKLLTVENIIRWWNEN